MMLIKKAISSDIHIKQLSIESLDAIPLPIIVSEPMTSTDHAGQAKMLHRFINRAFHEQIGYTIEEMPDIETWFELAYPDPDYRHEMSHEWAILIQRSQSQGLCTAEMTALIQCKSGQKKWFNIVAQIYAQAIQGLHIVTFRDIHALKCAVEENHRLSRTDPLTNLANRREAYHRIEQELRRFDRTSQPFSIMLCDIDHFKLINDIYGHACGDYMLCNVAGILRKISREIDCIARWGGEEFLLIMPLTDKPAALNLAERLRDAVERMICTWESHTLSVTISIGCATSLQGVAAVNLINHADKALYCAKNEGRNRVHG